MFSPPGTIPRESPEVSDRDTFVLWVAPHPRTTKASTPGAYAIPRSRLTDIKKYAPAPDLPCDGESVALTDLPLSYSGRHAPPAPDSCSCAPCLRPISARPIRWCESCISHPVSLPVEWTLRDAPIGTWLRPSYKQSACPSCNPQPPSQLFAQSPFPPPL